MKKSIIAVLMLASGVAQAQAPALKPGLWETKVLKNVVDGKDMTAQTADAMARMQDAMAKMTPEQRAMVESHMKSVSGAGGGGAMRICVSPAMAAKSMSGIDPHSHCPPANVSFSGNKMSFSVNCTHDGRTTVGSGVNVITGDSISSHVDMKSTDSRGTHTVQLDSQMTFVGSDCQGVKPMDAADK